MRLTAFRYGTTEITERMAFQDGREDEKIPVSLMFFLIEEGKRKILVDVGCDTMPGFELFEFEKPVNVLEKCGVMSEEITDVVITHSHHDHIAALYNYPKAAVYINEKELPQAEKYLPDKSKAVLFGKVLNCFKPFVVVGCGLIYLRVFGKNCFSVFDRDVCGIFVFVNCKELVKEIRYKVFHFRPAGDIFSGLFAAASDGKNCGCVCRIVGNE